MIELIIHPITISLTIIILAVLIKRWIDAQEERKRKAREFAKKTREFGQKTMRILRRKALRKSLDNGDWKFK